MYWEINYAEAFGVINRAAQEADAYQQDMQRVESCISGVIGSLSNSPLVASEVNGFAGGVLAPAFSTLVGKTNRAFEGTATAVNAYLAGQLEMTENTQMDASILDHPIDMPGISRSSGGIERHGT
ncbi:MAG: DUF6507 family protein [Actinomycetota bacterium]